jgi:hypothetical protein
MTERPAHLVLPLLAATAAVVLVSCTSASTSRETFPGLTPTHGVARTAEWAAIVADLDVSVNDREASPCHRGEPACFDAVIAEMEVRLAALGCDHRAPFGFTYLEMTRGVAAAVPSFEDPALLSLIDARFAQQYFDAVDNWDVGRIDDVPAAWQLAFAAADNGEASAAADLVMGMNAHISRDLAYAVALVVESADNIDGETDDYLRVNNVISNVKDSVLEGATERFDPNLFLLDEAFDGVSAPDPVELITLWRSRAFDLGLQLGTATTEDQRSRIEAEIERTSTAGASIVMAADTAQRGGSLDNLETGLSFRALDPIERDSYCAARLDSDGPPG